MNVPSSNSWQQKAAASNFISFSCPRSQSWTHRIVTWHTTTLHHVSGNWPPISTTQGWKPRFGFQQHHPLEIGPQFEPGTGGIESPTFCLQAWAPTNYAKFGWPAHPYKSVCYIAAPAWPPKSKLQNPKSKRAVWILDFGVWILDLGFWILDFGSWILDFGFWILDLGFWILDFGSWILDFGSWILDFGFWILDFGFWILDFGFWIVVVSILFVAAPNAAVWILDFGFWILDFGFWILDFGFWILDLGFWILDLGSWILDFGFWILDFGFSERFGFCIRLFYYTPTRVGGYIYIYIPDRSARGGAGSFKK